MHMKNKHSQHRAIAFEVQELAAEIDEMSFLLDNLYKNEYLLTSDKIESIKAQQDIIRKKVSRIRKLAGSEWIYMRDSIGWLVNDLQMRIDAVLPQYAGRKLGVS
jgi:hypothetical protein